VGHVNHALRVKGLKILRGHYNRIRDIVVDEGCPNDSRKPEVCDLHRGGTQGLDCKTLAVCVSVEVYEDIQFALGDGVGAAAVAPVTWQVDECVCFLVDLLAVSRAIIRSSCKDVDLDAKHKRNASSCKS
jgi:hypothetical protein